MLHYFDHAKRQLEEGRLDGAIIVSANNIMSPRFLAIYEGMGFSTADGKCRAFDEHGKNRVTLCKMIRPHQFPLIFRNCKNLTIQK